MFYKVGAPVLSFSIGSEPGVDVFCPRGSALNFIDSGGAFLNNFP